MAHLRIGFAMGGGVSLGAFCGAALTQAIKLLILRGSPSGETKFESIKIDVFSGASAGSMSLALMLRSLTSATNDQKERAREKLGEEFGNELDSLGEEELSDLVAAQVAQDLQRQVWVDDIDLEKLLGYRENGTRRNLRNVGSILDRSAVDAIAGKRICFEDVKHVDLSGRRLLAHRVLFGSAIANLTGTIQDSSAEFETHQHSYLGLRDGLRSRVHAELRVFDLNFDELENGSLENEDLFPSRWCRYRAGEEKAGLVGSLNSPFTWQKIAATSIACGAFPVAFEPVPLLRRKHEYAEHEWPEELIAAGIEEATFSYVDGGLFNNEPIREAFRMASFIDAQPTNQEFERCIIFVDPNVSLEPLNFRVPIHQEWLLEQTRWPHFSDAISLERRSSLDRLAPHLGQLLGMVHSQASRIEGDKIFQTRKRFELRDSIRTIVSNTVAESPSVNDLKTLLSFVEKQLKVYKKNSSVPATSLSPDSELERVAREEKLHSLTGEAGEFVRDPEGASAENYGDWLRALMYVSIDLVMDLSGKQSRNRFVAIAPFDLSESKPAAISLPGGMVQGFAGFTSKVASDFAFDAGRNCSRQFLENAELVEPGAHDEVPTWSPENNKEFILDLKNGMESLSERVADSVRHSHFLNIAPGVDTFIASRIAKKAKEVVERAGRAGASSTEFEFRIKVNSDKYELDGPGRIGDRGDIQPRKLSDGELYLITRARVSRGSNSAEDWSGPHLKSDNSGVMVYRDRMKVMGGDKPFCKIKMPSIKWVEAADKLSNPAFVADITGVDGSSESDALEGSEWKLEESVKSLDVQLGESASD